MPPTTAAQPALKPVTDTRPTDPKASAPRPPDAKPSDAKPSDAKPTDAKPSEAKSATVSAGTGADAKPADAKPGDAKSALPKPAAPIAPEKKKALEAALEQIDKAFGKGSIMRLGQFEKVDVGAIPTGSISLDLAIGIGGVPRGRIVEIFGPESSGKTTLALSIVANAQREGGVAAFVDAEHALDPSWAERIGVNLNDLLVSQPSHGEQALDIADLLVRSNAVDVIVVDSVAALTPKAELDGDMDDTMVGVQARMMSKAMRKLTGAVATSRTTVIFINQIREKIGVMFGNPETQPGGRALKFAASLRLDIRRVTSITDGERAVGNRTRVKVVKNKVAAPFTKAEFDIMYTEGISYHGDVIDLAVLAKVVQKSGAWFTYEGAKLGQGRENAKQFLKDNAKLCEEIAAKVRASNVNLLEAAAAGE